MSELKKQILKELEDKVAQSEARIEELDKKHTAQILVKADIRGGLLADMARNSCDKGIEKTRNEIANIKASIAWVNEMLAKYK